MKKYILIGLLSLTCIFAQNVSYSASQNQDDVLNQAQSEVNNSNKTNTPFKPATYLDTVATFDIPDNWVYEGTIFDENYSQKKYTYIKNLDVSVLYGLRDLNEEVKKKLPFLSADMLLSTMTEQNFVDILAGASDSDVVEKMYGSNKFYEFEKSQIVADRGNKVEIHSIIDMCIIDSNIFSFSYSYRDKKDAISDYEKMLVSFKLKNQESDPQKTETVEPAVEETKDVKTEDIQTTVNPEVDNNPVNNTSEQKNTNENTQNVSNESPNENIAQPENKNETTENTTKSNTEPNNDVNKTSGEKLKAEEITDKSKNNQNEIPAPIEENTQKPIIAPSGDDNNFSNSNEFVDINAALSDNTSLENTTEEIKTDTSETNGSDQNESIGVVISKTKKKNMIESIFSVIASNPIIIVAIIVFVIIDILIARFIKKKKNKNNKN